MAKWQLYIRRNARYLVCQPSGEDIMDLYSKVMTPSRKEIACRMFNMGCEPFHVYFVSWFSEVIALGMGLPGISSISVCKEYGNQYVYRLWIAFAEPLWEWAVSYCLYFSDMIMLCLTYLNCENLAITQMLTLCSLRTVGTMVVGNLQPVPCCG